MESTEKSLNPAEGNIVTGSIVNEYEFTATIKTGQLFNLTVDPRKTEKERERAENIALQQAYEMRRDVQRVFEGEKEKNVGPYADYLIRVQLNDENGAIPTIFFWTPHKLATQMLEYPLGRILVPFGEQLTAIDGETQLASRYEAAKMRPEILGQPVTIKVAHGRTVNWARQAFYDLNVLGVQPNAAVALAMDMRDSLTSVARELEDAIPFFKGRINKDRRQLRRADDAVLTITALRSGVVTLSEGITGVKFGTGPVSVHSSRLPGIKKVALEWFTNVTKVLGVHMQDRQHKVAGAPPVIAALGALGNELMPFADDDVGRAVKTKELLARLTDVNWEKGKVWEGILGKFTAKGAFSIGGTKETVYAVYKALSDPASPEGRQVRGIAQMQAAQAELV